ncbi:MAG: D-alanyl-D-alanine carboxypeptidase family protein [Cyanobacteria bacterium P01_D01_bin.105]
MTTQILQNRFEIETQLSCSDFSTVYLGCDHKYSHQPPCLITAIPYYQHEIRHRLEREAQILRQLGRHPQIPRLFTYFHERTVCESATEETAHKGEGTFYLVQDYINGHLLTKELQTPDGQPKKLSESYVTKLIKDVLVPLTFTHGQSVIHKNVHPQNLIRRKQDGSLFLNGFSAIPTLARSKVARDGTLSSTIPINWSPYVAPEQLRSLCVVTAPSAEGLTEKLKSESKAKAQPASDLYALGLIAIEALTGKCHSEFEYDLNSGLKWRDGTDVSLPLAEFIDRLIRQDWRDRFTDAQDALTTFKQNQHRHNIANDSRMPTVVAAPGRKHLSKSLHTSTSKGLSRPGAYTGPHKISKPHPYLSQFILGSLAALLALGIGVKTYQWGEFRLSQLPQTWQIWRDRQAAHTPADPQTLAPLLDDGSMLLQPAAAQAFWEMAAAASKDNISLHPIAGHSESEGTTRDYVTGYAIDIGGAEAASDWQVGFAQTPEFQWLERHASTYGFELATPTHRALGGVLLEPWHWRYVGDEASQKALGLQDTLQ